MEAVHHASPRRQPGAARDYDSIALQLLEPHADEPVARARRIAGIYATLYLEDPLLHQWCGLAAFVARQVYFGLETNLGPLQDNFARGNLSIYQDIVPAFLRFRDGVPVRGRLEAGFNLLRRADRAALRDASGAERLAEQGLLELARVEQREVCQPIYDDMGDVASRFIAPFVLFRVGWDTASPVLRFEGDDPGDPDQRMAWVLSHVLPCWSAWHRTWPERVRADLDRVRREGGFRGDEMPRRLVDGPG